MRNRMQVRLARLEDLPQITAIYNQAVINTVATFDTEIKTIESRIAWFNDHNERLPILVAEENSRIFGFSSLSSWSERLAYNKTAELSVYVDEAYHGQGLGKLLVGKIISEAKEQGIHTILSRIAGENSISVQLHTNFGFRSIGIMKEVGYKFDRYVDVHLFQLML